MRTGGDIETHPPPCRPRDLGLMQTRCCLLKQRLFLICGVGLHEKVQSGRNKPLWKGFIRYYNLSFLQGQGQRWLRFTPYSLARKIIAPCRVHLVHMEVLFNQVVFHSTQCNRAPELPVPTTHHTAVRTTYHALKKGGIELYLGENSIVNVFTPITVTFFSDRFLFSQLFSVDIVMKVSFQKCDYIM